MKPLCKYYGESGNVSVLKGPAPIGIVVDHELVLTLRHPAKEVRQFAQPRNWLVDGEPSKACFGSCLTESVPAIFYCSGT